eukprot:102139-Pelagomonas_calceolata.AAC.2
MGRDISEGIRDAVTGDGVNGVSYMLYVDDLSLTTNDPENQFKYLSTLVDKLMKVPEAHAVQPYMAAQEKIKKCVHEHSLRNRLWLSKVYGIPAGTHLCSLRRFLGVKSTATNWPVLTECGQDPLQFYRLRAAVQHFQQYA